MEYNNATTRAARAAATMRLTQAEIALRIALKSDHGGYGYRRRQPRIARMQAAIGRCCLACWRPNSGRNYVRGSGCWVYVPKEPNSGSKCKNLKNKAKVAEKEKPNEELTGLNSGNDKKEAAIS